MENSKLKEIEIRLKSMPALNERMSALTKLIEEINVEVRAAEQSIAQKKQEKEKLGRQSLASVFLRLTGHIEKKIDKIDQAVKEAQLKCQEALERSQRLERDRSELGERIWALREEQRIYEEEIDQRKYRLRMDKGSVGAAYLELEETMKNCEKELQEISQAVAIGQQIFQIISRIKSHLDSAEGWATYDVFSRGGIISHMAKYGHLDDAASEFERLESYLKSFKKELDDLAYFSVPSGTGIDSTTRAVDFWFDNIFTDLNVRSKIRNDKTQVDRLEREIDTILETIRKAESAVQEKLKQNKLRQHELVINFD